MTRMTATWRLTLAYHGGRFAGWQAQPGERTVQQELERALAVLAGGPVGARVAGRTDAGVHARGQVVSCRFSSSVSQRRMVLALNANLPDDISVLAAEEMPAAFDAKRHSVGKRYLYRVLTSAARDPFDGGTSWHVKGALDVAAMQAGAAFLVGEHDFESFRSVHCDAAHARRYLWLVGVRQAGERVLIEVRGNAFCRNQVRIIAGTLTDVGRGRHAPEDVQRMLAARDRTKAGVTAPAHGLFLEEVYYPDALAHAAIPPGAVFPRYPVTPETWPPADTNDDGALA